MVIDKMKFTYSEVSKRVTASQLNKLVDDKLREIGYLRSSDYADEKKVSRQAVSQELAEFPERFKKIEFGKFIYIKRK
jgi:hypothetical protein